MPVDQAFEAFRVFFSFESGDGNQKLGVVFDRRVDPFTGFIGNSFRQQMMIQTHGNRSKWKLQLFRLSF